MHPLHPLDKEPLIPMANGTEGGAHDAGSAPLAAPPTPTPTEASTAYPSVPASDLRLTITRGDEERSQDPSFGSDTDTPDPTCPADLSDSVSRDEPPTRGDKTLPTIPVERFVRCNPRVATIRILPESCPDFVLRGTGKTP